jgi:hypothetical protein
MSGIFASSLAYNAPPLSKMPVMLSLMRRQSQNSESLGCKNLHEIRTSCPIDRLPYVPFSTVLENLVMSMVGSLGSRRLQNPSKSKTALYRGNMIVHGFGMGDVNLH